MDNYSLPNKIRYLVAENESLTARINECEQIAASLQQTILELKLQQSENSELKSRLDEALTATAALKDLLNTIVPAGYESGQQSMSGKDDLKYQLEEQIRQYVLLQTQLNFIQMRMQELSKRNLVLQQQSGRVAQLESLLADAEQERDEWKALYNLQK